jgi:SynChlorMet cassette protein ScmC
MRLPEVSAEVGDGGAIIFLIYDPPVGSAEALLDRLPRSARRGLPQTDWSPRQVRWGRIWRHAGGLHVLYELPPAKFDNPLWERAKLWTSVEPIYRRAMAEGGLVIHGALIDCGGIGAILTAPGGTGKTTCSRRIPPSWRALSDDETLVVRDREGRYHAHPFPNWSHCVEVNDDLSWDVQEHLPLGGIFFLEQAEEDRAIPLSPAPATVLLNATSLADWGALSWRWLPAEEERAIKRELFGNVSEIARDVPCFCPRFSRTGCFWEGIQRVLAR